MIAALRRYPLVSALGMAAVVLVALIGYEIVQGPNRTRLAGSETQTLAAVQVKLLPPIAPVNPEQAYPETAARPLLAPTRRPAPEKAATTASAMPKGMYVLTGVTIVGPLRIALLRDKASGRVVRAEKGKEIVSGITVAEIEPESVTLSGGGDQEVIALQVQKGGAAPPPAPIAGPFSALPGSAPAPVPAAAPSVAPPIPGGGAPSPMPINPAARPPLPSGAGFGPASPTTAGQAASANQPNAALTPEELLARRRARRNSQTQ